MGVVVGSSASRQAYMGYSSVRFSCSRSCACIIKHRSCTQGMTRPVCFLSQLIWAIIANRAIPPGNVLPERSTSSTIKWCGALLFLMTRQKQRLIAFFVRLVVAQKAVYSCCCVSTSSTSVATLLIQCNPPGISFRFEGGKDAVTSDYNDVLPAFLWSKRP